MNALKRHIIVTKMLAVQIAMARSHVIATLAIMEMEQIALVCQCFDKPLNLFML